MAAGGRVINLAIVNRTPRATGPGLVVQERGRGPSATLLLAVAEATTKSRAQACETIAAALQGAHKKDSTAVTTMLTEGIQEAHRALLGSNGQALGREPVAAGITCAFLKGPRAVLAQAGPGLAYCLSGGELSSSAPDLGGEAAPGNALGIARNIHIHLTRYELEPGDTLLLATSPLAPLVSERSLRKLLAAELETAAQGLFRLVRDVSNFAAILYRHSAP